MTVWRDSQEQAQRVRRALCALRRSLPDPWHGILDEVERLLAHLPPGRPLTLLCRLRALLLRLSEEWPSYRLHLRDPEVPATNNRTKQAIARMQLHNRTVRGYKSWQGLQAVQMLSGSGLSWVG